ncbi:MAG TPA: PilZ domain-containing protein [Candidatus Omnitrophota bacterium]|nr:PilZ domain-containing protein [Candidatus Omnitrophota bacterium]
MNNQIPQIIKRKIGLVDIIDLQGAFVGPWALRGRDEIGQYLRGRSTKNLLVNLRNLLTVDSLGVKAITENLSPEVRSGLMTGNLSVMEMFYRVVREKALKFFKTDFEVVDYFGEDLVKWQESSFSEKRKHPRLRTALPLEFSSLDENGDPIVFHAIVTDLSEGGLLVEYLDIDQAFFGKTRLNPYDFHLLDMRIRLPGSVEILTKGKVKRTIMEGEQFGMGIEFSEIRDEDKQKIFEFLK